MGFSALYGQRSDPHTQVAAILRTASVGLSILGQGRNTPFDVSLLMHLDVFYFSQKATVVRRLRVQMRLHLMRNVGYMPQERLFWVLAHTIPNPGSGTIPGRSIHLVGTF